jgi:hypothetical protein
MKSLSLFGFVTSVNLSIEKIEVVFIRNQNGYLQVRHVSLFVLIQH